MANEKARGERLRKRGFACMDPQRQRELGSNAGVPAPVLCQAEQNGERRCKTTCGLIHCRPWPVPTELEHLASSGNGGVQRSDDAQR